MASSAEECETCADAEDHLLIFRRLSSHETKTLPLSAIASNNFMWEKLAELCEGEDPLPWIFIGDNEFVEGMLETPDTLVEDVTDVPTQAMAISYTGEKDLRELASYEEV